MIRKTMKIMVLMASLGAASAYALPDIDDLSGALSADEIGGAIQPAQHWFDQADGFCRAHDFSTCEVRLELQIKPEGGAPACKMAYTTIKTYSSTKLYCQVADTLKFPAKSGPTSVSLLFNIEPKQVQAAAAPSAPVESKGPPLRPLLSSRSAWGNRKVAGCVDQGSARSPESVNACFDANVGEFYWPFQHALARNPDMQGTINVKVSIAKDGHVINVTADTVNGPLDAPFVDAVTSAVQNINFHSASDDTTVSHWLNFN